VFSEVEKTLSIGLTQTNNIQAQSNSGINLDQVATSSRNGLETKATFAKQMLDYTGGYTLVAQVVYNKGLNGVGDRRAMEMSAAKLKLLNADWLMRSQLSVQRFRDDDLRVNSVDAIRFENTFGYLKENNSGIDIKLKLQYEKHDQDAEDRYNTQGTGVQLNYYFPHESNHPYWALQSGFNHNNASASLRDFNSINTALEYRQWSVASLTGNLRFQWQYDVYDQALRVSSTGKFMTSKNANISSMGMQNCQCSEQQRSDRIYVAEVNLNKAIRKNMHWQFSASAGHYNSSIAAIKNDFYQVASRLQWRF